MDRRLLFLFAINLLLVMGGCDSADAPLAAYDPHLAYPTTAQRKTAFLEIEPLANGAPTASDRTRIDAFLTAYRQRGQAPIAIQVNARSVGDLAARNEALSVAKWLQDDGIGGGEIRLFVAEESIPSGTQLTFPIYVVAQRDCGHWSTQIEQDWHSQDTDNFGCATQNNVDQMTTNPRDIVEARDATGRDGHRSWAVIDNYQQGKPIPGANDVQAPTSERIGMPTGGNGGG